MTDTSQKITLECSARTVVGKQNRSLRKSGLIPAVIFGESTPSVSVSIPATLFATVHAAAGETSIVYCNVDGKEIPTLISDVHIHPVFGSVNHVDFRRVNLTKKITAQVPVKLIGESPAVKAGGVLLQQTQEVEVEALPQDIPHDITVDVSTLTEIGQELSIGSLALSDSFKIVENPTRILVSVTAHKEESTESQLERTETEITTAKPDAETPEGVDAAKAEPAKKEEKK
jgi:large subunit ribosomal protein L25